jgi:hypothetical protein
MTNDSWTKMPPRNDFERPSEMTRISLFKALFQDFAGEYDSAIVKPQEATVGVAIESSLVTDPDYTPPLSI